MSEGYTPEECASLLRALADSDRLRIVQCLRDSAKNVSELSTALGMELANTSHHLGILRRHQLVVTERSGRFVVYRLRPDLLRYSTDRRPQLNLGCCFVEMTSWEPEPRPSPVAKEELPASEDPPASEPWHGTAS